MKKLLKISISIIIIFVFTSAVLTIYKHLNKTVDLNFAEQITLNYEYGSKSIHLNITDKADFDNLIDICSGTAINDFSVPSCGFGTVELVFEGDGQQIFLYPACDRCSTMRFGKKNEFFCYTSKEARAKLEEILLKYDVTFACI